MADNKFEQLTLFDIASFEDPGLKDSDGIELPRPFTKNQMRKWLKRMRWEMHKNTKRVMEKKRAKERRKEARINNIDMGPSRKALKKRRMDESVCSTGIIIDLAFDDLMIEKDRAKVIKQILRCYSLNRRSNSPLQFYVSNFNGKIKDEMSRHNGYQHWDVKFFEESYLDILPKEKMVYLTSESDNVIETFAAETYYIIGGLVDHNGHKGICHDIACRQLIRHARLPLDKYVNMKSRKVLTINHGQMLAKRFGARFIHFIGGDLTIINRKRQHLATKLFEIVLKVCEGLSWPEVLKEVLPTRKGAKFTKKSLTNSSDEETVAVITDNELKIID